MTTPQDFVKSISSWSVKDVMHAVELLKEEFGISDMALAPQAAAPQASGAAAEPAAAEEKTEFSVLLTGFGEGKKIGVIKAVKSISGVSLGDAKKIVEEVASSPYEVKAGIPKAESEDLKKQLEEAGGTVEVK